MTVVSRREEVDELIVRVLGERGALLAVDVRQAVAAEAPTLQVLTPGRLGALLKAGRVERVFTRDGAPPFYRLPGGPMPPPPAAPAPAASVGDEDVAARVQVALEAVGGAGMSYRELRQAIPAVTRGLLAALHMGGRISRHGTTKLTRYYAPGVAPQAAHPVRRPHVPRGRRLSSQQATRVLEALQVATRGEKKAEQLEAAAEKALQMAARARTAANEAWRRYHETTKGRYLLPNKATGCPRARRTA